MNVAVVVFPGSHCDADAPCLFKDIVGLDTGFVWFIAGFRNRAGDLVGLMPHPQSAPAGLVLPGSLSGTLRARAA